MKRTTLKNRIQRRVRRGVTLIEVLVVLAIITTVSAIIGFAVLPKLARAKLDAAQQSAKTIREAAERAMEMGDAEGCPTVKTLLAGKEIKADATDDPWGTEFRIVCEEGGDVHVYSNGKDKQENTKDDIRDDFKKSQLDAL
ncbi:MAG: prepilin-type N-terminal cleavage/methylation domain-containing protein [Polyangiaceae bacterium]